MVDQQHSVWSDMLQVGYSGSGFDEQILLDLHIWLVERDLYAMYEQSEKLNTPITQSVVIGELMKIVRGIFQFL